MTFDVAGWSATCRHEPVHSGRIGIAIKPRAIVVHTTDMAPSSFTALIHAWQRVPGKGNAAHFLVGRSEHDGVVQLAPIYRNANHAGGPSHGAFVVDGKPIHPNHYAVGIEVHNAGQLQLLDGKWTQAQHGVAYGPAYDPGDVILTSSKRGYHKPSEWQMDTLFALLTDLHTTLPAQPAGTKARANVGGVQPWAARLNARVVGHCTLDPIRKGDPWPWIMARIAERFGV